MPDTSIRLNKYISDSSLCSRRAADRFIEMGEVLINGRKAKAGDKVWFGDLVEVNGQAIIPQRAKQPVAWVYHQPVQAPETLDEPLVAPGKIDEEVQGLIFMTNDGVLAQEILRAGSVEEKEFRVKLNKPVTETFLKGMAKGVPVLGTVTKKCKVVAEGSDSFRITLIQEVNRQIKRMCEHFGFQVTLLELTRFLNIKLEDIAPGTGRELGAEELSLLQSLSDRPLPAIRKAAASHKTTAIKPKKTTTPAEKKVPKTPAAAAKPASRSTGTNSAQDWNKTGGPDRKARAKNAKR